MSELRLVGYVLVIAALGLGVATQFVPSGELNFSGFGADVEVDAYPWGAESSVSGIAGAEGEDSKDWFEVAEESDEESDDGLGELQAQMVLGYIGMGLAFLGLIGAFVWSQRNGSFMILFGGLCALVAIILFATGIDSWSDEQMDLAAGYWLQVSSVVAMVFGGVFVNRF